MERSGVWKRSGSASRNRLQLIKPKMIIITTKLSKMAYESRKAALKPLITLLKFGKKCSTRKNRRIRSNRRMSKKERLATSIGTKTSISVGKEMMTKNPSKRFHPSFQYPSTPYSICLAIISIAKIDKHIISNT